MAGPGPTACSLKTTDVQDKLSEIFSLARYALRR